MSIHFYTFLYTSMYVFMYVCMCIYIYIYNIYIAIRMLCRGISFSVGLRIHRAGGLRGSAELVAVGRAEAPRIIGKDGCITIVDALLLLLLVVVVSSLPS